MSEKPLLTSAEELRGRCRRRIPWAWILPAACLLFALGCAAFNRMSARTQAPVESASSAYSFAQLAPDGAGTPVSVTISQNGETYELKQDGESYVLDDGSLKVDSQKAAALLACGASILSRSSVEGEKQAFGLDADALTATFAYADGQTMSISLGDAPATGEGRYACVDGSAAIHVVNASLYDALSAGKYALAEVPDLSQTFTAQTLMEVTLRQPDRAEMTIRRVTEDNPFNSVAEFTAPVHYPANSERTAELFLALAEIAPVRMLDEKGEDAAYGLDAPLAEIDLADRSGKEMRLTIGSMGEEVTLRIDDQDAVYALASDAADFLKTATVAYLAEQLPGLVALSEVDEVVLCRGEETWNLSVDRSGEQTAYAVNGESLEEEAFLSVYQAAIGLLIDRYSETALATEPVRAYFEYHLSDGTVWTLAFAEYDEATDAVVRDGEANFLISRSKVDAVFDALQSSRDQ